MKKILLIIFIILITISCGTKRSFVTAFFEKSTTTPQEIIDSIGKSNLLPELPIYKKWPKAMYYTSDSTITTQYLVITQKEDTTYIFSVTENKEDSVKFVKFRKE